MRALTESIVLCSLLSGAAAAFFGCTTTQSADKPRSKRPVQAAAPKPAPAPDPRIADMLKQAKAQADALTQSLQASEKPAPPAEPAAPRPAEPSPAPQAAPEEPAAPEPPPEPAPEPAPKAEPEPEPPTLAEARAALAEALRRQDVTMDHAVLAAALAAADGQPIDSAITGQLPPDRQATLARFRQIVAELARQTQQGGPQALSADAVAAAVRQVDGPRPLRIKNPNLCRRVLGFGVYETFESRRFLAGRQQPMIVYAELDHFRTSLNDQSHHEVRLEQEIALYNAADGLAVWKSPKNVIVDASRNQRQDFFVVQMIHLPASLSVGKFHLKLRLTDTISGSVDEVSLPLEIVADRALVAK